MKYFLRSLLLLLASSSFLMAQPIYNATDYAAQGDTFIISRLSLNLTGLDFAATGAATTWDYSSIQPNAQDVIRFQDPADAGYRFAFITNCVLNGGNPFTCPGQFDNNTNLALQTFDGSNTGLNSLLPVGFSNVVRHFNKETNRLEETILGVSADLGGTVLPVPIEFNQPDTILRFPISFGAVDSAQSEFGIDLSALGAPVGFIARQTRLNTVEGYGSITTPLATYANALKIRTIIVNNDSVTVNGMTNAVNQGTEVIYSWYVPGIGVPVLEASGTIALGQELITQVDFLDTLRCIEPVALFFNFPLTPFIEERTGAVDVNFTNLSSNADSYTWNFGDGATSTASAPQHTYTAGGLYQVELIACNSSCQPILCDTLRLPLLVIDSSGVAAAFNFSPQGACMGDTVFFDNFSFNADTYAWDFGDGTSSTDEEPTHIYSMGGTYDVELIATSNGQSDTLVRTLSISSPPTVDLGSDRWIGAGGALQLNAVGTGGNLAYTWSFAPGLSCYLCPDPIASPDMDQTYIVTATNTCGSATDTLNLSVFPLSVERPVPAGLFVEVFPNPVQSILELRWKTPAAPNTWDWQVYDLAGRIVSQGSSEGRQARLDVKSWPTGIYLLHIQGPAGQFQQKIQKR